MLRSQMTRTRTRADVEHSSDGPSQALDIESPLVPGSTVSHYEILRHLGQGGMGQVYLARDTRLGRLVAIKFLLMHGGPEAQRFLAEARVTAQCRHENIVVIYDVDEYQGYPYMVLEFIEGRTLRQILSDRDWSTANSVVDIVLPVLRALACAHDMGIVHRDLKPENIMLSNSGEVKVLDFGIAKKLTPSATPLEMAYAPPLSADAESSMHESGMAGTVPYMAPEQWFGEALDVRVDIWAVGILLFELSTGEHPLATQSLMTIMDLTVPMPGLPDRSHLPKQLAHIVDRCLKKNREERYASVAELQTALEGLGHILRLQGSSATEWESPFAGLSAFQESDAGRFFGRDRDIAVVLGKLRHQPLVVIAGPSGVGKSSFVRAGVLSALKRTRSNVETFTLRPGRAPLAALAELLARVADELPDAERTHIEAIVEFLKTQPGYLGTRLRDLCRRRGEDYRIVLFIDQMEELYTLGIDKADRSAFCACIEGVADDASSPLRILATIRVDFLDRVTDDRRFMDEVARGLWFLPPLGPDALLDALKKPVEAVGYRFEDDALCTQMISDLEGTKSPLPLLQFTATRVWEARNSEARILTREAYVALGGIAGALSTHADAVFEGFGENEQKLARMLLLRLVTPERTRAIASRRELSEIGGPHASDVERVLGRLIDARLLVAEGGNGEGTVELVHESLIDRWPRLHHWLEQESDDAQFRERLRTAAKEWEARGRVNGLLWRGEAADDARHWWNRRNGETATIHAREAQYLAAVIAWGDREKKRKRQFVSALVASLSVVVVLISVLAIRSSREATLAKAHALRADQESARAKLREEEAARSVIRARNATRIAVAQARQADPMTVVALLREVEGQTVPRGWSELLGQALSESVPFAVFVQDVNLRRAVFSPDGKQIATGALDHVVRLWNTDGKGKVREFRGHEGQVRGLSFSPDGRRLASGSEDKTVRIWNIDGSGPEVVLRGHDEEVRAIDFSPDGQRIASASVDRTVRIWNMAATNEVLVLRGHKDKVIDVVFSPDGQRVASASADQTVHIWSARRDGKPIVLRGHEDWVWGLAFSPDGRKIASGSADHTLRVWNADGAGEPQMIRTGDCVIHDVAFHPDGQSIATACREGPLKIWNVNGRAEPRILRGHDGVVYSVMFNAEGSRIVSASYDKTVRLWPVHEPSTRYVFRGHTNEVHFASFSPNGRRIASASGDTTIQVWNADGSGTPISHQGHNEHSAFGEDEEIFFSADGERIVSTMDERTLGVWNTQENGDPIILRGHDQAIKCMSLSPDGRHVASGGADNSLRIWPIDGSGEPIVLQVGANVKTLKFSRDGKRIVGGLMDKTIQVWNADGTGKPVVLQGHEDLITAVSFSADGTRILSGSRDHTLRWWNADGSSPPLVLDAKDHVWSADLSPDEKHIAAFVGDRTVKVWNADGHGEPIVFTGHNVDHITYVAWSPDNKHVVAAAANGLVLVWSIDGTEIPLVLRSSDAAISSTVFSPDGQRIVAASKDGTVTVWKDLQAWSGPDDERLWRATTYCMPLEVRRRLLDFPDTQSLTDLQRCQERVRVTHGE